MKIKKYAIIYYSVIVGLLFLLMIASYISAQNEVGKGFPFGQNKRLRRGVNIIGYDPLLHDTTNARMKEITFN
jgi:endoglucanase